MRLRSGTAVEAPPGDGARQRTRGARRSRSPAPRERDAGTRAPPRPRDVPLWRLMAHADGHARLCVALGVCTSALSGASMPLRNLLIGRFTDLFATARLDDGAARARFADELWTALVAGMALAAASWLVSGLSRFLWTYAAELQTRRVRELYVSAALRQSAAWRELHPSADVMARLTANVPVYQEGVGEKVGMIVQSLVTFVSGVAAALWSGWRLALVVLAVFPVVGVVLNRMWAVSGDNDKRALDAYARAAKVAQEALSSMRTVVTFNMQAREVQRYVGNLGDVTATLKRNSAVLGLGWGLYNLTMFLAIAASFHAGGYLLALGLMSPGDVMSTFTQIAFGVTAVGNLGNYVQAVSQGRTAAAELFDVIESSGTDARAADSAGMAVLDDGSPWSVEFRDVVFAYPARPEHRVLDGFSLHVAPGTSVGVVARSGSGKSTLFHLLLRLYEPSAGAVLVNGMDVRELDLRALRRAIGIVSQDVVLFDGTVADNVRLGADDPDTVSQVDVERVCRIAQAHDFITHLPDGYNTRVSAWNSGLSGGQQQRIAIARVLLQNPRILLLDEATSALDAHAEADVQRALDMAIAAQALTVTVIVVSHRNNALRSCASVVALEDGRIVETGTPAALRQRRQSRFSQLVSAAATERGKPPPAGLQNGVSHGAPLHTQTELVERAAEVSAAPLRLTPRLTPRLTWARLRELVWPLRGLIAGGVVGSVMEGLLPPMQGVVLAGLIADLALDRNGQPGPYGTWTLMLAGLGMWSLLYHAVVWVCFGRSKAYFVERLRADLFAAVMRQDQAFFDAPENAPGRLCARLAGDMHAVESLSGALLGEIVKGVFMGVLGLSIAFWSNWRLTLLMLVCIPAIAAVSLLHGRTLVGFALQARAIYEQPMQYAAQALRNARQITLLAKEAWFVRHFSALLEQPFRLAVRQAAVTAAASGLQDALLIAVFSIGLQYSGQLLLAGLITNQALLTVMITVTVSSAATGVAVERVVNGLGEAWQVLEQLYAIIDRVPVRIDLQRSGGFAGTAEHKPAHADLQRVGFAYPQRPDAAALEDVSALIRPGSFVGVVGQSGSGKSTLLALLQRLYDPDEGVVLLDGHALDEWALAPLRARMCLVAQDADVFDLSIRDNIAYGRPLASDEDVVRAATAAGAHDFVKALPDGYQTRAGERGSMLSGGQRQRIALARALIVDPALLLLDEATSALDAESEAHVRRTLEQEQRRRGRTIVSVAHQAHTIAQADEILVFAAGRVVERGTHEQLRQRKGGAYAAMLAPAPSE